MELSSQVLPARAMDGSVDLLPYVRRLVERWLLIGAIVAITILAAALYDIFLATRSYQSYAVLRPMAGSAVQSRISGAFGGIGGGAVSEMGGLAATLGGSGGNDADEYTAIMDGFTFSTALSERYHLAGEWLKEPSLLQRIHEYWSPSDPKWEMYRILLRQFDCAYSRSTGNMTLTFISSSPASAQQVLGYYVADLRNVLRAREIADASAAISSLREEAFATADPLLRSELYSLEAKQLERKKMAQIEADFAFRVLDGPAASDKKYRPRITFDCVAAALLGALAGALFILLRYGPSREESRSNVFQGPVGRTSGKIGAVAGSA